MAVNPERNSYGVIPTGPNIIYNPASRDTSAAEIASRQRVRDAQLVLDLVTDDPLAPYVVDTQLVDGVTIELINAPGGCFIRRRSTTEGTSFTRIG